MKQKLLLFALATVFLFGCSSDKTTASAKKIPFVEDLLSKMTIEEKVGQMNQYTGFYDGEGNFMVEAGKFDVMVGTNSQEGLKGSFEIK